jgi:retinol dehydrogenase-14
VFTCELARRLEGTGVTATALHPGLVRTSFSAEDPSRLSKVMIPVLRPFMKAPARGAATSIYLASAPEAEGVTGRYFANRKPKPQARLPTTPPPPRGSGRPAPT